MSDAGPVSEPTLRAENVTLTYQDARNVVYAVRQVDLAIGVGEFAGILGNISLLTTSVLSRTFLWGHCG